MASSHTHPLPLFRPILALLCLLSMVACASQSFLRTSQPQQTKTPPAAQYPADRPLAFIPNQGQADSQVLFQAQAMGSSIFFTASKIVFALPPFTGLALPSRAVKSVKEPPQGATTALHLRFEEATDSAAISGAGQLTGVAHFYTGNDPSKWHTGLPTYHSLVYTGLYPGIELTFEGLESRLKGTFRVAPYADPQRIRWRYEGVAEVRLDPQSGNMLATLAVSQGSPQIVLVENAPLAWQEIEGHQIPVSARYLLARDGAISFDLGKYDPAFPLTIDPEISFSTYLGGSSSEWGRDIAVDSAGNVYVTGYTQSDDFPIAPGPSPTLRSRDVFLSKLSSDGQSLLYSAFLGGSGNEEGLCLTLDEAGYVYLGGRTSSTDFPLAHPIQDTYQGGDWSGDGFVMKLDPSGALLFSTYLGGTGDDSVTKIATLPPGQAYITGWTKSNNFPTTPLSWDNTLSGEGDAFAVKLDTESYVLEYSVYLGGTSNEVGTANQVAADGSVHLTGYTWSTDFPLKNAYQDQIGGGICFGQPCTDAYIARLSADGQSLLYGSYLGGNSIDMGMDITLDQDGNVILFGSTASSDFPTRNPLQGGYGGGMMSGDLFITKLDPAGQGLIFSTYLGGQGDEQAAEMAVDRKGDILLSGTPSECIPVLSYEKPSGVFVLHLSGDGQSVRSFYQTGGSSGELVLGMDLDDYENVYLTGETTSTDFPMVNPWDSSLNGQDDVFILKLGSRGPVTGTEMIFLPEIKMPQKMTGIYGYVTSYYGCAAPGASVELRFYNGSAWITLAKASTAADGLFSFPQAPSLAPGQLFYVRYTNDENDSARLGYWATRALVNYTAGSNILIGDFNLLNIHLVSPANGAAIRLPAVFTWQARERITDSYEWNLFDGRDGDPSWWTDPALGYTNNYQLTSLPVGFKPRTWYAWMVGVYGPDGGYGFSYWAQWVNFTNRGQTFLPDQFLYPLATMPARNTIETWYEERLLQTYR